MQHQWVRTLYKNKKKDRPFLSNIYIYYTQGQEER